MDANSSEMNPMGPLGARRTFQISAMFRGPYWSSAGTNTSLPSASALVMPDTAFRLSSA